jgi:rare lipoprotein A
MNQNHWTCLTTVFLTTALAPIGNVHAKNLPVSVGGAVNKSFSVSPKSLIVTPRTTLGNVNERGRIFHQGNLSSKDIHSRLPSRKLIATVQQVFPPNLRFSRGEASPTSDATDRFSFRAAAPTKLRVPAVSNRPRSRNLQANIPSPANRQLFKQSIDQTLVTPTPVIRPDGSRSTIVSKTTVRAEIAYSQLHVSSIDGRVQNLNPRSVKTNSTQTTPPVRQSIDRTMLTPTSVVRPDGSKSTIMNATNVRAEIANTDPVRIARAAQTTPSPQLKTVRVIDRAEIGLLPQSTPVANRWRSLSSGESTNRPSISRFETGLPQYIFDNGRPLQIVATTIAQVGTETGSSTSSIAIPVKQPTQSIVPNQQPIVNGSIASLSYRIGTKTAQPIDNTAKSALDRVVATQTGTASWYASASGAKTANGERFDPNSLTAAHRNLPFGTKVRVTSLSTGKMVVVRINDRGPVNINRMIDVSAGAASAIGIKDLGVGTVRLEVLANNG